MIFVYPILIPANTAESAPVVASLGLSHGTITLVAVQFPSGVNALAHLKILNGLHQLFPTNQGGDFATGGETIVWDEEEDIAQPPFALSAIGWNDDVTYDHTITVRLVMKPLAAEANVASEIAKLLAQGTPGVEQARA